MLDSTLIHYLLRWRGNGGEIGMVEGGRRRKKVGDEVGVLLDRAILLSPAVSTNASGRCRQPIHLSHNCTLNNIKHLMVVPGKQMRIHWVFEQGSGTYTYYLFRSDTTQQGQQ